MARKRDRLFAAFGAGLFIVSTLAVTVIVIVQANSGTTTPTPTTTVSCVDNNTETPLSVPDIYKPAGAVTTLQKTDLVVGTGAAAKSGDCLVVKYYGTLASDGTKFDETFTTTTGFAFNLGQGSVIPGWDQGLVGMQAGGTRRLVIPSALAYGTTGSCKVQNSTDSSKCDTYAIPPNTDLVFVVKLLRIQT